MPSNGKSITNGDLLKTADRRSYVLGLRKAGATFRDIARAAHQKFPGQLPEGYDCRYAYKDVKRELDKLREQMRLDTEAIREMELQRLDAMLLKTWQIINPPPTTDPRTGRTVVQTVDPDLQLKAIDKALKISDRRLKLVPDLQLATLYDLTTDGQPLTPPIREVVINHPEADEQTAPTLED